MSEYENTKQRFKDDLTYAILEWCGRRLQYNEICREQARQVSLVADDIAEMASSRLRRNWRLVERARKQKTI